MAIYLDSTKYCNIFLEQESFIDTYRMKLFPESRRSVNIQSIEIYSLKGMNIFDLSFILESIITKTIN